MDFISDRISYIVLRDCLYNSIVLNVHAPSEEKSGDSEDSFMRNRAGLRLFFYIPHENSVKRFQCKSGEREYFQTDNWE